MTTTAKRKRQNSAVLKTLAKQIRNELQKQFTRQLKRLSDDEVETFLKHFPDALARIVDELRKRQDLETTPDLNIGT